MINLMILYALYYRLSYLLLEQATTTDDFIEITMKTMTPHYSTSEWILCPKVY